MNRWLEGGVAAALCGLSLLSTPTAATSASPPDAAPATDAPAGLSPDLAPSSEGHAEASPQQAGTATAGAPARGEYLFHAGGCANCHTASDGAPLAGGVAIRTAFGTFYGTNITPDPRHGIGGWSEADFLEAMQHGRAPDGGRYWPVFPYSAYTRMSDADLRDLWAWLSIQPAASTPNRPHEIAPLYRPGIMRRLWRGLNFEPGRLEPDPSRSEAWNRGNYLVNGPGHCGECHTPRDRFGGYRERQHMAGGVDGEGHPIPNITPDRETGIGDWTEDDVVYMLQTGILPDGDVTGGEMHQIVQNGTARLTGADQRAMAVYLRSISPVRLEPAGRKGAHKEEVPEDRGDRNEEDAAY